MKFCKFPLAENTTKCKKFEVNEIKQENFVDSDVTSSCLGIL